MTLSGEYQGPVPPPTNANKPPVYEGSKTNKPPIIIAHHGIQEAFPIWKDGTPPLRLQPVIDGRTGQPLQVHEEERYIVEDVRIPLASVELIASAITSPGYKRAEDPNEDTEAIIYGSRMNSTTGQPEPTGLFLVCDGMGGHGDGQIASVMAANTISESFMQGADLGSAVQRANSVVFQYNQNQIAQRYQSDAGTLCAGFSLREENGVLTLEAVNVGDSSTVVYRPGVGLIKISIEHNLAVAGAYLFDNIGKDNLNELFTNDEVYNNPTKSNVTASLGHNQIAMMDTFLNERVEGMQYDPAGNGSIKIIKTAFLPQPGDIVLGFCDGLWEMVRYPQIEAICAAHLDNMQGLNAALVEAALRNGGKDNVSVVSVKIVSKQDTIHTSKQPVQVLQEKDLEALIPTLPAVQELVQSPEQLNEGDPVRVPVPSPHGILIEQLGWSVREIRPQLDGGEERLVVGNDKGEIREFTRSQLERLNPKRIEDIIVDLDNPTPDFIGALRYALDFLPEKGIYGSTGTFYSIADLNRMIDKVIQDPTWIDKVTSGGNGVFQAKLEEIVTAMEVIKVGDPVLMPIAAGARAGRSEGGWTVIALDQPRENWAIVQNTEGKTKATTIASIQERTPSFIGDVDLKKTPDPRKAVDHILLHKIGGFLQSRTSETRYTVQELRKMFLGALRYPQRVVDVTPAAGLRAATQTLLPLYQDLIVNPEKPMKPEVRELMEFIDKGLQLIIEGAEEPDIRNTEKLKQAIRYFFNKVEGNRLGVDPSMGRVEQIRSIRNQEELDQIVFRVGRHAKFYGSGHLTIGTFITRNQQGDRTESLTAAGSALITADMRRKFYIEMARIGAEEWIHAAQEKNGGPLFAIGFGDEADIAAYFWEKAKELDDTAGALALHEEFLSRYQRRIDWYNAMLLR